MNQASRRHCENCRVEAQARQAADLRAINAETKLQGYERLENLLEDLGWKPREQMMSVPEIAADAIEDYRDAHDAAYRVQLDQRNEIGRLTELAAAEKRRADGLASDLAAIEALLPVRLWRLAEKALRRCTD